MCVNVSLYMQVCVKRAAGWGSQKPDLTTWDTLQGHSVLRNTVLIPGVMRLQPMRLGMTRLQFVRLGLLRPVSVRLGS